MKSNACYADIGIRRIMPNQVLCRADLDLCVKRDQTGVATRHKTGSPITPQCGYTDCRPVQTAGVVWPRLFIRDIYGIGADGRDT